MLRLRFCKAFLVAVCFLLLFVVSGILSAQGRGDDAFERVKQIHERHTERLMAIKGIEGTAVGVDDDHPVVKVFLERPGVAGIPKKIDGALVQVEVTGKFYALPKFPAPIQKVNPAGWCTRPVPIGVSTGHPNITAGTIGCRVKAGGNLYALSNNHVYADENEANIGDNILQPGPYDGGGKIPGRNDVIGTLYAFEPIKFDGSDNTIDAAITLSSSSLLGKATPSGGYGTPKSAVVSAKLRQSVQKYGRTTRLTKGKVYATNATVNVTYDNGTARFVNQIIITPGSFSAGGDSGSLIVTDPGKNPVGLLFAGSYTMTVANPISNVLSAFGVTIDGE
jgi:hypothetical protein